MRVSIVSALRVFSDAIVDYLREDVAFQIDHVAETFCCLADEKRMTESDVILIDATASPGESLDLISTFAKHPASPRIALMIGDCSDSFLETSLQIGVVGIISAHEPLEPLADGIQSIGQGDHYFSEAIENRIVYDPHIIRYVVRAESPFRSLTNRQLQVLRLVARGYSVKEIAKILHLSPKSVDSHKCRLMSKLGIHDRVHLARIALREGLIPA